MTHKELLESILETLGESAYTLDWEVYDGCLYMIEQYLGVADTLDCEVYDGCLYMIEQYLGVGDMCPDADIETDITQANEEELTRLISGEVWQKDGRWID